MSRLSLSAFSLILCTSALGQDKHRYGPTSGTVIPAVRQDLSSREISNARADGLPDSLTFLGVGLFQFRGNGYLSVDYSKWERLDRTRSSGVLGESIAKGRFALGYGGGLFQGLGRDTATTLSGEVEGLVSTLPHALGRDRGLYLDASLAGYLNHDFDRGLSEVWSAGYGASLLTFADLKGAPKTSSGRFMGPGEIWAFAGFRNVGFAGSQPYNVGVTSLGLRGTTGVGKKPGQDAFNDDPFLRYSLTQTFGSRRSRLNDTALTLGWRERRWGLDVSLSKQGRHGVFLNLDL